MTKFRKLNQPTSHRVSMLRTMVSQLVKHERIETTVAKGICRMVINGLGLVSGVYGFYILEFMVIKYKKIINCLPHPLVSSKKQASSELFPIDAPPELVFRSGRGRSSKVFHGIVEPIFK
ncbi:hypothetical protein Gotur_013908, partial [Gossypium turneri]